MLPRVLRYTCVFCLRLSIVGPETAANAAAASEPDPASTPIRASQLDEGLHLLQGTGGNVLLLDSPSGLLLVDADYGAAYPRARDALAKMGLAERRVHTLINTHFHNDHTDGNAAWAAEGAAIVAHENVRKRLASGARIEIGPFAIEMAPAEPAALPTITFERSLELRAGARAVFLQHFLASHTDGDTVVFIDQRRIVHMGDVYVRYGFPFIDVPGGGTIDGMIRTCRNVLQQLPADALIVPGHGEPASPADLHEESASPRCRPPGYWRPGRPSTPTHGSRLSTSRATSTTHCRLMLEPLA
jgi:cyclase